MPHKIDRQLYDLVEYLDPAHEHTRDETEGGSVFGTKLFKLPRFTNEPEARPHSRETLESAFERRLRNG